MPVMIETQRLLLRTWQHEDAQSYFHINQDPKVIAFLPGPLTMNEVTHFLEGANRHQDTHGYALWAVELKDTGERPLRNSGFLPSVLGKDLLRTAEYSNYFSDRKKGFDDEMKQKDSFSAVSGECIGFIGLRSVDWDGPFTPAVEVGWRLASPHWGKGYGTEGAKASLDYGFQTCGLEEIVSFTVPGNIRSLRVMEKIGMKRDVNGDFAHPKLPKTHRLSRHVLYRVTSPHL